MSKAKTQAPAPQQQQQQQQAPQQQQAGGGLTTMRRLGWITPAQANEFITEDKGLLIEVSESFKELGFSLAVGVGGTEINGVVEPQLVVAGSIQVPAKDFFLKANNANLSVSPLRIVGYIFPEMGEVAVKGEGDKVLHAVVSFNYLWLVEKLLFPFLNPFISKKDKTKEVCSLENGEFTPTGNFWDWTLDQTDIPDTNVDRPFFSLNARRTLLDISSAIVEAVGSGTSSGTEFSVESHQAVLTEVLKACQAEVTRYGGKADIPVDKRNPLKSTRGEAVIVKPQSSEEGNGRTLSLEVQEGVILLGQIQPRIDNLTKDAMFTGNIATLVLNRSQAITVGAIPDVGDVSKAVDAWESV
jgi:hypothetical protein